MTNTTQYTFGDSDLAAARLRHLADAYEEPTRALLGEVVERRPRHVVDLGSGPGHTTRLLHEVLAPDRTTGLERSPAYLAAARSVAPPGVSFVECDVLRVPLPVADADFVFCRHLLAHVVDLRAAISGWAALGPTGVRLVIQETETMESGDPVLRRYYASVAAMQAAHGQATYVGASIDDAFVGTPWRVVHSDVREVRQPAATMARLHAMNLRTWRRDPAAVALFSSAEMDRLTADLDGIAKGDRVIPPVVNGLREVVADRV